MNLTPDQITKLNDKYAALQKALVDWDVAHKEQFAKLSADMKANEKDPDALGKLRAQNQALYLEKGKLDGAMKKEMYDVLTLDQKLTWAGIRLYREQYSTMVKALNLSADQEAKLKALAKTSGGALATWDMENGEKARTLEKQIREAQAALDALRAPREKIYQEQTAQFNTIITPDLQIAWRSYRLQQEMTGRFYKANLTAEQTTKVRTLCDVAAKEMLAASSDGRAISQAYSKLTKAITDEVLTAEQRVALTDKATPPPTGGR